MRAVALSLVEAYARPHRCLCDCHAELSVAERTEGVAAMMTFDDAMRGWGLTPLYEPEAPGLFQEAKMRADPDYRSVAVRDHACLYRRLVGFAVHELIHAVLGEPDQANWGIPWGLPYGVPDDLPEDEVEEFLFPYNLAEACAFVGVASFAEALFGIRWSLLTARDVGTYGFAGGRALVPVPDGFRAIPHVDRQIEPRSYYQRARALQEQALAYIDDQVLADWCADVRAAAERGRKLRNRPYPEPEELARLEPVPVGRNDKCVCGSGKKYKRCCGR
jgi:hypothetical protein